MKREVLSYVKKGAVMAAASAVMVGAAFVLSMYLGSFTILLADFIVYMLICTGVVVFTKSDRISRCIAGLAALAVVYVPATLLIDLLFTQIGLDERIAVSGLAAGTMFEHIMFASALGVGAAVSLIASAVSARWRKKMTASDEYKSFENDPRNMGQFDYMYGKTVKHIRYSKDFGDHEHCRFCSEKISYVPGTLSHGYCTVDTKHPYWICPRCYDELKKVFNWQRVE